LGLVQLKVTAFLSLSTKAKGMLVVALEVNTGSLPPRKDSLASSFVQATNMVAVAHMKNSFESNVFIIYDL
jgi:hypothetical protein